MTKRIFVAVTVFLASFSNVYNVYAEEGGVKVNVVSTIPTEIAKGQLNSGAEFLVIQIRDQEGNLCYGIVSSSKMGRQVDGGYPNTSIDCIPRK